MDALTFQTPILLRKMTFSSAKAPQLQSISYDKALEGLELTHDEFVDLCILLGCDYCDTIKGVGMKTALKLIREHKTIEKVLEEVKGQKKYAIPPGWLPPAKDEADSDHESRDGEGTENAEEKKEPEEDEEEEEFVPDYVNARRLFKEHEVDTNISLKWKPCQAEELKKFLVDEMCFNPDRVDSSIKRLQESYKKHSKPQARLDSFFKVKKPAPGSSNKRKAPASTAKDKKGTRKKPAFKRR